MEAGSSTIAQTNPRPHRLNKALRTAAVGARSMLGAVSWKTALRHGGRHRRAMVSYGTSLATARRPPQHVIYVYHTTSRIYGCGHTARQISRLDVPSQGRYNSPRSVLNLIPIRRSRSTSMTFDSDHKEDWIVDHVRGNRFIRPVKARRRAKGGIFFRS